MGSLNNLLYFWRYCNDIECPPFYFLQELELRESTSLRQLPEDIISAEMRFGWASGPKLLIEVLMQGRSNITDSKRYRGR